MHFPKSWVYLLGYFWDTRCCQRGDLLEKLGRRSGAVCRRIMISPRMRGTRKKTEEGSRYSTGNSARIFFLQLRYFCRSTGIENPDARNWKSKKFRCLSISIGIEIKWRQENTRNNTRTPATYTVTQCTCNSVATLAFRKARYNVKGSA